ncbi:MAG: hypothetical protein ABIO92_00020 [Chloroflexia bacterium]
MNKTTSRRFLPLLMAGAFIMPVFAGWGSTTSAATTSANRYFFQSSSALDSSYNGMSSAREAAIGLSPQSFSASSSQVPFAHAAFQRTWERTDKPVASGQVQRSWYWGPTANTPALNEEYIEGAGGRRLVQYFDKSRMEINNPAADPNSPFFVTNGLLTVELISGRMQTGNATFVDRYSADIPLASDPDDANAPTYISFRSVSNTQANSKVGLPATATIARNGTVGDDATKASYPKVNIAYFDQTTRHNVPQIMWEFLNETGPVYNPATGQTAPARLSDPWFYTSGLPISEAYWARTKIAGQMQDVLIQAFERRVVTYVPNGVPGFKVQVGNIGQHYYDWRYKNAGRPSGTPPPVGTPTAPVPGRTPTTPPPTAPPAPACTDNDVPQARNATITPRCGDIDTTFDIVVTGFRPNENISFWFTAPNGDVVGTPAPLEVGQHNGRLEDYIDGALLELIADEFDVPLYGIWAMSYQGEDSSNLSIVWFKLVQKAGAGQGTPTAAPPTGDPCANVPASNNVTVRPRNCAPAGTVFSFDATGFQPGENVGVYITLPDQSVFGAPFQVQANGSGAAGGVSFTTARNFPPGVWAITFEGVTSRRVAVGYFKITAP